MHKQRAMDAIVRIERGLGRIEQALVAPGNGAAEELERLRSAHQLLRSRVEGAIGEIDRLLADGGSAS
jgi:hypothetical protein